MPIFRPITTTADLPIEGDQAERYTLDIKKEILPPFDSFELAKDVAAFANVAGGIILVGAAEDRRRGTVGRYFPMSVSDAKALRDAFSEAVRDRCSPVPVVNPEIVARGAGFVLAVSVWPFPGQAVGVLRENEPRTYAFPIRVGVDTKWLYSEQLPMLMVPELRRITILVDAMPAGATVRVGGATPNRTVTFEVIGSEPLGNVLKLRVKHAGDSSKRRDPPEFNLPLDVIRSVWCDANAVWQILVEGDISETGNGSALYTIGKF